MLTKIILIPVKQHHSYLIVLAEQINCFNHGQLINETFLLLIIIYIIATGFRCSYRQIDSINVGER